MYERNVGQDEIFLTYNHPNILEKKHSKTILIAPMLTYKIKRKNESIKKYV